MRISWCAYVFFYKFINYTSYTVMQRNTGVLSLEEFSVTINCEIPTIHRRNNEASQRKDFCLLWNIPTRIYGIFSILEKLFSPMNERYPLVRSNFKPILFFFFLFLWKRWKKKKKNQRWNGKFHFDLGDSRSSSFDVSYGFEARRLKFFERDKKKKGVGGEIAFKAWKTAS